MTITPPIHSSSHLIKAVNSKNAFTIKGFQQNPLPYLEKFTPKVLAVTAGLWGLHALYRTIKPRKDDPLKIDADYHKGKNIFMNTLDNIDRSLCKFNKSITSTKVFFGSFYGVYLLAKYTDLPTNFKIFTHCGIYFSLYGLVNGLVNKAMKNPENITSTEKTFDETKIEDFSTKLKEKIKGQDHVAEQIHKELEISQIKMELNKQ
jgi:hypothetical protein